MSCFNVCFYKWRLHVSYACVHNTQKSQSCNFKSKIVSGLQRKCQPCLLAVLHLSFTNPNYVSPSSTRLSGVHSDEKNKSELIMKLKLLEKSVGQQWNIELYKGQRCKEKNIQSDYNFTMRWWLRIANTNDYAHKTIPFRSLFKHTFSHRGKSFLQFVVHSWSKCKIVDKHNSVGNRQKLIHGTLV